jgi:hypothetical protein
MLINEDDLVARLRIAKGVFDSAVTGERTRLGVASALGTVIAHLELTQPGLQREGLLVPLDMLLKALLSLDAGAVEKFFRAAQASRPTNLVSRHQLSRKRRRDSSFFDP